MRRNRIFMRMVSTFQRFPFETKNGEHYLARHPNIFYQNKRNGFKGKTFSEQANLPSLPVPELETTLAKYLQTIKPFCSTPEQFKRQELLCAEFLNGKGPVLQERLVQYSQDKRNWMGEFWDNQAYLEYNDPIVPYVSYFYAHRPLPVTHKAIESDPLVKAAAIISSVLKFLEAVKDEALPPELIKGTPFCMNSFQMMFNNSRIPGDGRDANVFYSLYEYDYITVAYKGNFYKVYTHNASGDVLTPSEIWLQLYKIKNSLSGAVEETTNAGIGSLTSLPRNEWFAVHQQLISNPLSRESLETIYKSAFVLCLDENVKPITFEEKSRNAWHGDGFNRFYDKPLQFFVAGNGNSGFLAEHSKMDGTPTLFLNDYVCQQLHKLNPQEFVSEVVPQDLTSKIIPEHLPFVLTPSVQDAIKTARSKFKQITEEHDLRVWHYNRYGKRIIKQNGFSPDAFIQQIIQLAVYKYLGKQLPTYEAASTRKYFKGRTETGRSVSLESATFVQDWENPAVGAVEKVNSLRASAKTHSDYLKMAADGHGVDRHFFGLKNMLKSGEIAPKLFQDPLFNYSGTWLVSTSQLSSEYFEGYGWSQVNDNGFGLAYMLNNDWMHINIVNKPEKSGLSVHKLHYYLTQAADEILDTLNKVKPSDSKL